MMKMMMVVMVTMAMMIIIIMICTAVKFQWKMLHYIWPKIVRTTREVRLPRDHFTVPFFSLAPSFHFMNTPYPYFVRLPSTLHKWERR
jgi:hypothetical protein